MTARQRATKNGHAPTPAVGNRSATAATHVIDVVPSPTFVPRRMQALTSPSRGLGFRNSCVMLCLALASGIGVPRIGAQVRPGSPPPTAAVDPSVAVTLSESLRRAREARPQVDVAAAGVERARGTARLGALIPNPQSSAQGDARTPTRQATLSQPLGWMVRRGADVSAGRAIVARAAADSAQVLADVGRVVQRAFFGALAADEALRLATEQAHLADSLVVLADRRVATGDISAIERDQLALEAARARLSQSRARALARVARVEFARAIAWIGTAPPRPEGSLNDGVDATRDTAEANTPTVDAIELRILPSLSAALADSAAAASRQRAVGLARIPIPSVVAGVEWGAAGAPAVGSRDARVTPIFGLSMPLPFWNQGREALAEARGAAQESAARAAEARLTAAAMLRSARIRVAEAALRARYARDTLYPDATRIRSGSVRLYDAGRTGLLPVLDALRVERDVALTLVQELLGFQEARADLNALLGQWP